MSYSTWPVHVVHIDAWSGERLTLITQNSISADFAGKATLSGAAPLREMAESIL